MYLADGRTTATTGEMWIIAVVAVAGLAFWLIMVVGIAPRPGPAPRRRYRGGGSELGAVARRDPLGTVIPGQTAQMPAGDHAGAGIAPEAVAEPRSNTTGSDTTGPDATGSDTAGSDTAATRDDSTPVPSPRHAEPVPADPSSLPRGPAGHPPTRPPGAEKADMETSTDDPGVQWTARTPPQRQSATDEGAPPRRER